MGDESLEQIVMTPKSKTATSTVIVIERRKVECSGVSENGQMHVAGGNHTGLVINKQIGTACIEDEIPVQMSLEFKVFLVNATTKMHTLERRTLRFWFSANTDPGSHAKLCQEFFKELVSPSEFPRDYVGFIMKLMKLMQNREMYSRIRKIEIELQQLKETSEPPERPMSADDGCFPGQQVKATDTKLLEIIESAYPNPLTLVDICRQVGCEEEEAQPLIKILHSKGLIKEVDQNVFTRVVQNETEVKVVKQMPKMVKAKQPTIAIITAQYCEKLAVDAMIENQETFVRYTTVGESNVYTLGNIGSHRVVSTKLPSVGHTREAMIAAGNTTTRLLGTFQKVDYVFLIGTGGGVPHFTDYDKHVRLGDVVVSAAAENQRFVYLYCGRATEKQTGGLEFETKGWVPTNCLLQEIAAQIRDEGNGEWDQYVQQGLEYLDEQEANFSRPPIESDKLYMAIGEKDVIEVAHPVPNYDTHSENASRIHMGPVASGRQVSRDDHIRQELASRLGILAYDSEFDSVLESVLGNRRDSFIVIRGIADYKDGTKRRDWQPHSALLAAAYAKAIITRMDPPTDD